MARVLIIGSGFSGMSAACFMAKAGWEVTVVEKHDMPGGRARQFCVDGFRFDMGPSWYWMPEVFSNFFAAFDKKVSDYYHLQRLDPSYRVYTAQAVHDIPADLPSLQQLFESFEKGAGEKLLLFLREAEDKYRIGMQQLVFQPGLSISEFADWRIIHGLIRLNIFNSIESHIRKYFRHPFLRRLLEFPVLFLGALPSNTPALYSLLNYADMVLGTWYPKGGIYSVVNAMHQLACGLGVKFHFRETVTSILVEHNSAKKIVTDKNEFLAEVVIGGADYHFIETSLLPPSFRSYSNEYWDKRTMAPSCLLFYVGLNKRLQNIQHHNLFLDTSFEDHALDIYVNKTWPANPSFYVSVASVTDPDVAPAGGENLVFLVPVAAGLEDDLEIHEKYFDLIKTRFEKLTCNNISDSIVFRKSFGVNDFIESYNAFKGNAYGLANTLWQTAVFKPRCRSKKVKNLFYTGQLTVPGPGVPPSLISGQVVAEQVIREFGSYLQTIEGNN